MDDLRVLEKDLAARVSRFKDHPLFVKGGPLEDRGEGMHVSFEQSCALSLIHLQSGKVSDTTSSKYSKRRKHVWKGEESTTQGEEGTNIGEPSGRAI
jgi:hypothetical protein